MQNLLMTEPSTEEPKPVSHADQQRHQVATCFRRIELLPVGAERDNLRQQIVSLSVPVEDYRMSSTSGPDATHAVVTNPRRAFQL